MLCKVSIKFVKNMVGWKHTVLFSSVWLVAVAFLAWWSYALIDGNLTLIQWAPYVEWQTTRWQETAQPVLLSRQYLSIVLIWWASFIGLFAWVKNSVQTRNLGKFILGLLAVTTVILMAGHNAHSRDIYNYLFNAKMVVNFQADPHIQTALEFSSDPWTRFMHNIHTPAPYGYGWTYWSLLPFVISGSGASFLLSYVAMRGWIVLGWLLLLGAIWFALRASRYIPAQERWWRFSLFALNPLVIMETVLNGHNDVWMMAPAIAAWGVVCLARKVWHWPVIILLLVFSAAMKFATIVVWPIFIALLLSEVVIQRGNKIMSMGVKFVHFLVRGWIPDLAMIALLIPLFTARSQQFHPWYAIWFLAWIPFGKMHLLRWVLLGLSMTSQLRYLPWIEAGFVYNPEVQWQMRLITWSGLFLGVAGYQLRKIILNRK